MPVAMVSRKAAKHMKHMMDKNEEAKTGFLFRFLVDFSFAHFSGDMGLVGIHIPGTQMTLVLVGKDLVLIGFEPQNRG